MHCWKPNRPHIHKVGMAENLGRRKGEYSTHTFEPEFSRIYEINDGFDLLKIETAIHNKLERAGVKVGPEWFEIEAEKIDQFALELFGEGGLFDGALKDFHQTDPTEIERLDTGSSSSSGNNNSTEIQATEIEVDAYAPQLTGFVPREDQLELLDILRKHFIEEGNARGQIRLPPGYGKTQIGCCLFPIVNAMERILILVPSIKLAEETAERVCNFHRENLGLDCFKYYQVHSKGGLFDIDEMNRQKYVCVVGVYNSVAKLQGAKEFDAIIFDEAHRTSIKSAAESDEDGEGGDTHFTFALSNLNIQAKYRLFMTATPRIIINDDNSMCNVEKYGKVLFSMTIRQAVNKKIINAYKIWMYVKTHNEVLSVETDGERFALLLKFLEQCNGTKTLIVCRSIKACNFVASRLKAKGLTEVYSVHSQMHKNDVDIEIKKFKETKARSCLCAVNMFKEGIDCPAIDSVVFYDERSSVIDVLQIVGRGLRYKEHIDFTDIGILCSVNPSERLDDQSEMRYLRMIIQNMFDHSEEVTNHLRVEGSKQTGISKVVDEIRTEMKDDEDTAAFQQQIAKIDSGVEDYGQQHFQQAKAYAQERSALYGWRVKDQWSEYIERNPLPRDIPRRPDRVYKNMGWVSWDDFLGLDVEKPFDLNTLKYVLQKELKSSNPSAEEYSCIAEKYGIKKVINPSEFYNVYKTSFYDFIESIYGKNYFMSLTRIRKHKSAISAKNRGLFNAIHYKNLLAVYKGELPHFPLVYYNAPSFLKL